MKEKQSLVILLKYIVLWLKRRDGFKPDFGSGGI